MINLKSYLCTAIAACLITQSSFAGNESSVNNAVEKSSVSVASTTPHYLQRQPKRVRATPPPREGLYLVMLGTRAGPFPSLRAATSTALVVDGRVYVIDAGSGLVQRFYESGLNFGDVQGIFITHLHSDHVDDLYPFVNVNFPNWKYGKQKIALIGPDRADANGKLDSDAGFGHLPNTKLIHAEDPTPGIKELMQHHFAANAYDMNNAIHTVRRSDDHPRDLTGTNGPGMLDIQALPAPKNSSPSNMSPKMKPIQVYQDDYVKVTAALAQHPMVYPAWSYRFDTKYGSVTFSGDTAPNDNLMQLGRNTDILINEVMDINAALAVFAGTAIEKTMTTQILDGHTAITSGVDPRSHKATLGVGAFAAKMGAKGLVLNHIWPDNEKITSEYLQTTAEREFKGPVHASEDLDLINISEFLKSRSAK
ncbi:MBL fold metallo-hydrolase [Acinetobacter rudis]|uniref:MBL fold metallo-hydrolase n=1 Tax=Acinetobacter rudis TaxID=632955 RepID=A0AAW8JA09_9GAMM|nr:MBL fold metallo-hydrolase [Acinetobacter rudis]MDQ8935541.1 MBL fold metallo-hydrolase [Acinetobacter rudis]MDQ8953301.1 MBL fold metallo-hydrolase [Acinetobacter rudis]MDQ9017804.1 MBL fold metallo-hydrolase [Acinetobacter rudis]